MAEQHSGSTLMRFMYKTMLALGTLIRSPDVKRYKKIKKM